MLSLSTTLSTDAQRGDKVVFDDVPVVSTNKFEDLEVLVVREDAFDASSWRRLIAFCDMLSSSRSFGFVVRFRLAGRSVLPYGAMTKIQSTLSIQCFYVQSVDISKLYS
jgi:hypothetical protein